MLGWKRILIHHSATRGRGLAAWESIRRYHVQERGWQDIGYHYGVGVDRGDPLLLFGRSVDTQGAHCPGQNRSALGVCFLGDFTKRGPEDAVLEFGADFLASLCRRFLLPADAIHPHRAFRATECPGRAFPMDELLERVALRLNPAPQEKED